MHHLVGRVVDEDVDAAEFSDRAVDHRPAMVRVRQVTADQYAFAARLFDITGDIARVLVLVQIGDENVGALTGKRDGDGAPECRYPRR